MKTFAHRGWSAGEGENTLLAFKKSVACGVDGVEFDVRFDTLGRSVIVTHDPADNHATLSLSDVLLYLKETNLELLIECKEYSKKFYALIAEHLRQYDLADRTIIFAFPEIARQFPWEARHGIKLGVVVPYPKDIKKFCEAYNPDMILLGWGNKKERFIFKLIWSAFSLPNTLAKYPLIKFVIGVAYTKKDKQWLIRQTGLYGITADMPLR